MNDIKKNIKFIYKTICTAAHHVNRDPLDIKLIAVTKNQSIDNIKTAISLKQKNFGENYAQEALQKIQWFKKNTTDRIIWHFIGTVQSNKSRIIAEHFDWCHTICSAKLIYRLHHQRPSILNHLNVLIQINVSDDQNRSGISTIDDMLKLAKIIHQSFKLKLRGIMSMSSSSYSNDFNTQLIQFKKAHIFFQQLQAQYSYIDTLSLGMSNDIIPAVYAGSTLVRIGTTIFGSR